MEKLEKIKIKMEVINQYGDRFAIEQEVDEEYTDDGEMGIYHNAYLSFLKAAGFCLNINDRVVVICDKENCDIDNDIEDDDWGD